jgi:hypothetical protein
MTNISVSTAALAAAAPRLQAQSRAAEQRAHGVEAVLRNLDLEIKAREHFDVRLRALSGQLTGHAQHLSAEAGFLTLAAGRYEGAEEQLIASQALGDAKVGAPPPPGGGGARPPGQGDGGVRPASLNDFIRLFGDDVLALDAGMQESLVDLIGAIPLLGTYLTWDEILTSLQNNSPDGITLDVVMMVAVQAAEKGFGIPGIGTLASLLESVAHIGLSDQFQDVMADTFMPNGPPSLPALDWVVSGTSGAVSVVSDVADGITQAIGGLDQGVNDAWDWVTPW